MANGGIGVSVTFLGVPGFEAALTRMATEVTAGTPAAVRKAAEVMAKSAGGHINSQSGALAASIQVVEEVAAADMVMVKIGPTVIYGRKHELGKRGRYHARGHPYLAAGVTEGTPAYGEALADEWRRLT